MNPFYPFCLALLMFFLTGCKAPVKTEAQNITQEKGTINEKSDAVFLHGKLAVSGAMIVDEHKNPVQLFGMSFFWSQWMGKYYTRETVSSLTRDWRCTVIRAAMGIENGGYLQNPEKEKKKIFALIDAAIEEGIYIIVDWHDHHAQDHLEEAKAFFSEVARTYGQHPNIIYELYNEPLDVSWTDVIKPYCEEVIRVIRVHDPDNIIACGSRQWSQRVDEVVLNPIPNENIVYTLHYYAGTHKQNLRDIAQSAIEQGLPLIVTEFGTTPASGDGAIDEEETLRWWAFLDQHKISWCNWSIADKRENSAALKPGTAPSSINEENLTRSGAFIRTEIRKRAQRN